ncbi:MAG: alpha/beta hydrolase [Phycisphaerae bacterium]
MPLHRRWTLRCFDCARAVAVAAACLLVLAGCGSPYPFDPFPPRVRSPALGEVRRDYALIKLFYATDRARTWSQSPLDFYGTDRAAAVNLGTCDVSIPATHGRGALEEPGLLVPPRPERHVLLLNVSPPEPADGFFERLRPAVERSESRALMVFVHGYNVTFAEAARRAAQIAHDVEFEGVAMLYSWPAQGFLLGYLVDGVNAEWSSVNLERFLQDVRKRSGAQRIHLLAHSMGTRVVSGAVRELVRDEPPTAENRFAQIVIAAGDMDAQIFERDYAPALAAAADRVTLYVSGADWALGGSRRLHRYSRLGELGIPANGAPWRERFDVIDATAVDKGVVGHVYYGSSPTILQDLGGVLGGAPPIERGLMARDDVFVVAPAGR